MAETLDQPLLVMTDHTGDDAQGYTLTPASHQLLTLARSLTTGPITAIALNSAPDMEALGAQGVAHVLSPDLADHSPRISAVVADAVRACFDRVPDAAAILCVANYRGREVAARLAVQLDSGAAVDVSDVHISGGVLHAAKTVLAGTWETTMEITRGTPIIGLRPSSVQAEDAETATTPDVTTVPVKFSAAADAVQVPQSVHAAGDGRVSLTDADVVVVGGRGTGGDFSLVEQLADELGGAVGATRVASDEGWVPRSIQIGQTGVSVAPSVYIGLGVSGAIHHTVGMQASDTIIAVCDDPDAPIFEIADFGIVGDIFEVVPQALEDLRARKDQ